MYLLYRFAFEFESFECRERTLSSSISVYSLMNVHSCYFAMSNILDSQSIAHLQKILTRTVCVQCCNVVTIAKKIKRFSNLTFKLNIKFRLQIISTTMS